VSSLTLKEIWLDVYIENIAAQSFDRIIKCQNVHALAIFNVETLVDMNKIAKLDAKIVTCNLVHLYATLLNIIGAQTDEDRVPPLLPAKTMCEV
jgi:hypothetical protein